MAALAVGLGVIVSAPAALAGTHTLRWTHPDPATVDGFKVHTSVDGGAFDNGIDLSKPLVNGQGIFVSTITVPDGVQVELRMSAYSNVTGLGSVLSAAANTFFLLGAPGKPQVVFP